jgi:GNAT superfamily N-acetyltransferase
MLTELPREQYPAVRALFRSPDFSIEALSILEGNTRGQILVDDPGAPRYAVAWDELATIFVAGSPGRAPGADASSFATALRAWIAEVVIPQAQGWGIPDLTLVYDPPGWSTHLSDLSARYQLAPSLRYRYAHTGSPQPTGSLPPGYSLHPVDAELLDRTDLTGLDWLGGWVLSFWPSPGAFLDRGIGYVVIAPSDAVPTHSLVSLCISVFVSGNAFEFGTATDEAHRSRGLSTAVTRACVNAALARKLDPVWHCWADNAPSVAVARKSGFELQGPYQVLRLWVPAAEKVASPEG